MRKQVAGWIWPLGHSLLTSVVVWVGEELDDEGGGGGGRRGSGLLSTFYFLFFLKFIYLWLHRVFVAAHGLSLVVASGGYSSLRCVGFSLRWLLLLQSTGSRHAGFSNCGTRAR